MTEKEAIMYIQSIPNKIWEQLDDCEREAMEIAFKSLEKQIPKKPIEKPTDDSCLYYENYCPNCENLLIFRYKQCPRCGQRLDW